jgi:hypothetical protein
MLSTVTTQQQRTSHGCAWFDVGDYYTWVGEAFMGGFIKAYLLFRLLLPLHTLLQRLLVRELEKFLLRPDHNC